MNSLGTRIHARRRALGLSLRELGGKAGLSASYLSELERDMRGVGADSLMALSRELGVTMEDLAKGTAAERVGVVAAEIPPSLARFAREADLPFRHVVAICRMQQIIMDHRIPPKRTPLDRVDWLRFYEAVKPWL